jgi:hypothetical protein
MATDELDATDGLLDPALVEREALTAPPERLAAWLQDHLGQQIAAYLAGLKDAETVGRWASGKARPRGLALSRMQSGYQAARLVGAAYGDTTARSWLFGTNPVLGGAAPAAVLRDGRAPEDWNDVVPAALQFIDGGAS